MATSSVYLFFPEQEFYSELTQRLRPYGVSVEKKYRWEDLHLAFAHNSHSDCLLLQVHLGNFHSLIQSGIFRKFQEKEHAPVIALTHDASICALLEKYAGGEVEVVPANILLDRLVRDILNRLPVVAPGAGKSRSIATVFGKIPDLSLDNLLDFCNRVSFTGRIMIRQQPRKGMIELEYGKIVRIVCQSLPPVSALKTMLKMKEATVEIEQRIFHLADISEYIKKKRGSADVSLKDVLIDLFYFMHRHFEPRVSPGEMETAVENILGEFSGPVMAAEGVYFIYNREWQEKLKIIGTIDHRRFRRCLDLFEAIFNELSPPDHLNSFRQFLDSLNEIKPVIQKLQPFDRIMPEVSPGGVISTPTMVLN